MAMQRDFWVKDVVWEKVAVQKNFWVKNGAWGQNGHQKGLFWVKNEVLGGMGIQWEVWGKWVCKGTFG